MKRILIVILVFVAVAALLGGCENKTGGNETVTAPVSETAGAPDKDSEDSQPQTLPTTIRIGGLRGATSMGMVKLLKDAGEGKTFNSYDFLLAGSADEITPKLISGELDIAAVPANLASVLYNNTGGKVKLLAINTLGVLYIVEKGETIKEFADLRGKTIYATGRGSAPEYVLYYLLEANGLDPEKDITIEWKSEPSEVVSLMAQNQGSIAMMPQPYVTVAQGAIEDLRIAADLTREWERLDTGSMLLTGVLVVRTGFADEYPGQIEKFLTEYRESTDFVNANIAEAAVLIEEFDIFKAAVAEKALPFCNITFYAGQEMKAAMQGYLQVLFDRNPQSVGGTLPDDNFYYG